MTFTSYIDTLFAEKNIDLQQIIEVEGSFGTNFIPVEIIVDQIKRTTGNEAAKIRSIFQKI